MKIALFNRFEFELPDEAVEDCHHQGPCDEDVAYWQPKILAWPPADDIRAELKEYGAWNQEELSDDDANQRRLLWIAAGNIQDEEFSNES